MDFEYTFTIEVDDETDEVTVPADAVDGLAEEETPAEVAGDLIMLGLTQQLHAAVHHGEGLADDDLIEAETELQEAFEERFGISFEEMTGHSH